MVELFISADPHLTPAYKINYGLTITRYTVALLQVSDVTPGYEQAAS